MKQLLRHLIPLSLLALLGACGGSTGPEFDDDNGGITLPDGFRAVVVADSLGPTRHLTVDSDGDIYAALNDKVNGSGVVALRDEDGDGVADRREYFGNVNGTGIQLHNGYLYFGTDTSVVRWPMEGVDLVPQGEPETVISELPVQRTHAAKSLAFDGNGNIYVNIGAPSNACQQESRTPGSPGMDPCPQLENHAGIWRFNADLLNQSQSIHGRRFGTGIRNAVALEWNSDVNHLYVVQHGRDQLYSLWPDRYTRRQSAELPAEELMLVRQGDNFGWPYAYYDGQKEDKMLAPEYGGDGETPTEDGRFKEPVMAFPGHWAPNDLLFYQGEQFPGEYRGGAFIAFHGSWNRGPFPQEGYRVTFVPFGGEVPSGDYRTFADGFAGSDSLQSSRAAEYRPTGLAEGPDGSLYISDDTQGRIWRVVYTGN